MSERRKTRGSSGLEVRFRTRLNAGMREAPHGIRAWLKRNAAYLPLARIFFAPIGPTTLGEIKAVIRRRFPDVSHISGEQLEQWLADTSRPAPLLFDARSPEEYEISHLPGARNVRSANDVPKDEWEGRTIVTYCAVGYRSSALASALIKRGAPNVFNLEGAIFGWANEGRPLFRGAERISVVHAYSSKWGQLLRPELRA